MRIVYLFVLFFSLFSSYLYSGENIMILKLKYGDVEIELYNDKAPNHVKRFIDLADNGKYDNVVFHRVIDGFMAQSGGSDLPNLKAEFSDIAHTRGVISAARSSDPNSANSQFFICFESAPHLDRQYSAFGKVIKGMEFVDMIKKGEQGSGAVSDPDKIISIRSK